MSDFDAVEDKLLRAAARGFELESSVEIDDDARIERLARQFEKRGRRAAPALARRFALGFAAALLLVGAVVGAIQLKSGFSTPSAPPRAVERVPAAPPAPTPPRLGFAAAPRDAAEPAPAPPPSASVRVPARALASAVKPEPALGTPAVSVESAESPPAPPPPSASELFSAGNKARSRGDAETALGLYRRLQAEYPAAPEALAARISIGMLELQRGQASSALAQFRAYRQANARALRAEALWGEAQALGALGRSAEERAALESLLNDHPSSAYAPAARKRLGRD
jgi:TolA-binding protein